MDMKMAPQVLFLPASHELSKEMGCPEVCASEYGTLSGSDECEVPMREFPLYITMSYAHDPWADFLGHWVMVVSYLFSSVLFIYSGVLSFLALSHLPKFKAKWNPPHCQCVLL